MSNQYVRHRLLLPLVALLACAVFVGFGIAPAVAGTAESAREQLSGVWQVAKPVIELRTLDGKEPPLQPEAARLYQEHRAARGKGDTSFDSATWCASAGIPRLMLVPYPFELIVQPSYVTFLYEWNWWTRIVDMSGKLKPAAPPPGPGAMVKLLKGDYADRVPGAMGWPVGRWDDATLVIETTGLIDSTLIDSAGLPHSDDLKLTERLRLVKPDVLEDVMRVEDPATFTQPWETRVTYRRQRGAEIHEDVCLDRIRDGSPAVREK